MAPALRRWIADDAGRTRSRSNIEVAGARGGRCRRAAASTRSASTRSATRPGISGLGGDLDGDGEGFTFAFDPKAPFAFRLATRIRRACIRRASPAASAAGAKARAGASAHRCLRVRRRGLRRVRTRRPVVPGRRHAAADRHRRRRRSDAGHRRARLLGPSPDVAGDRALARRRTARRHGARRPCGRLRRPRRLAVRRPRRPASQADARISDATAEIPAGLAGGQRMSMPTSASSPMVSPSAARARSRASASGISTPASPHFGKAELTVKAQGGGDAVAAARPAAGRVRCRSNTAKPSTTSAPAVRRRSTFDLDLPLHRRRRPAARWHRRAGRRQARRAALEPRLRRCARPRRVRPRRLRRRQARGAPRRPARQAVAARRRPTCAIRGRRSRPSSTRCCRAEDAARSRAGTRLAKPYVAGRSPWTIAVCDSEVAAGARSRADAAAAAFEPGRHRADLPAPLRKPAAAALAPRVDADLPLGSGDIAVALRRTSLALRARSATADRRARRAGQRSRRRSAAGLGIGRHRPHGDARCDRLDRADARRRRRRRRRRDCRCAHRRQRRRLLLLGGVSPTPACRWRRRAHGIAVRCRGRRARRRRAGAASRRRAAIAGRFQRVHWRAAKPARDGTPTRRRHARRGADRIRSIPPRSRR